ncbi:ROK family protein [Rhodocaloribacter litoris]|uniref:ROK family protein n=1 Tax=Rhodocaloribacter litoris TaxID=2558931 RepID=UPI001422ABD4|nr:ROK family protein [Rhodocaloribacter litoris]QXD14239.1 ROK family protein [Rhodocaloribacter litoris]GIV59886.1 MAG: fructokinase [Rhodothermaceae bacterium]
MTDTASPSSPVYGAVEAGGTKFVCAIGTGPDDVRALTRFPTTTPEETLARTVAFFQEQPERPVAVGVGSFGPVDPDPASPSYGFITRTPKPNWSGTDVAGVLRRALGVPVVFDTDVNAAGLGEHRWGAARGLDTFIYLTVGTGIGGGGLVGGQRLHGLVHPEMGHVFVPRAPGDDFAGHCPFHGTCLEGMASGPALQARWGRAGAELPPDHPAWEIEAHYLAYGLVNFIVTLSPQRIILGGGVMHQRQLFPMIRHRVRQILNGYVAHDALADGIDAYIVPPALGDRAGVLGALALAREAA